VFLRRSLFWVSAALTAGCHLAQAAGGTAAYVRVSQVGYEVESGPFRAYLMSASPEPGATFRVLNRAGKTIQTAAIGALQGTWSNSPSVTYHVYALDFAVPESGLYSISVSGPAPALSPVFAVDKPKNLYSGLLLNAKFFYETQRDGANYKRNALRAAPGHLNDAQAVVYQTPPLDDDDNIATSGTPLKKTGKSIDASGGWWDAGDYMKYVETISYTVALQEIGVRDFPKQMGAEAPVNPPRPPGAISYSGDAAGAPSAADFTNEAEFGLDFLLRMWDDKTKTLYYQVGNSQDWVNFPNLISDYDIWRLPQADDNWNSCKDGAKFICHRPVFAAGPAGAKISPNLAGRLAADFAGCYVRNRATKPDLANRCLKNAEDIFELADLSFADPAGSVDSGTCASGCLQTIIPFDGYPETVWDDDMELGATELYFALQTAHEHQSIPGGLPRVDASYYLARAAHFAHNYISNIYANGASDTLNLYDVSGLAHFELYRALCGAGDPKNLEVSMAGIRDQFLKQVNAAVSQATSDVWGFGAGWTDDTTSHGAGISVMASEAYYLTGRPEYNTYAQRWMANVLGANAWGSSFFMGDGSATFPNCIQHQVANLAGATNGTAGGTPILWGAASEGPAFSATSGALDGMIACPADGSDVFAKFNGNDGSYNSSNTSVYQDNVQSYSTTEPAIDLTASSFLMWSWRIAGHPDSPQ
jgi:endoglucanase